MTSLLTTCKLGLFLEDCAGVDAVFSILHVFTFFLLVLAVSKANSYSNGKNESFLISNFERSFWPAAKHNETWLKQVIRLMLTIRFAEALCRHVGCNNQLDREESYATVLKALLPLLGWYLSHALFDFELLECSPRFSRVFRQDNKMGRIKPKRVFIAFAYFFCALDVLAEVPSKSQVTLGLAFKGPLMNESWLGHQLASLLWGRSLPSRNLLALICCICVGTVLVDKKRMFIKSFAGAALIWLTHCFFPQLVYFACARLALNASLERKQSLSRMNEAIRNIHQYKSLRDLRSTLFSERGMFQKDISIFIGVPYLLCIGTVGFVCTELLSSGIAWDQLLWYVLPVIYYFFEIVYPIMEMEHQRDIAFLEARAFIPDSNLLWTDAQIDKIEAIFVPERTRVESLITWAGIACYPTGSLVVQNMLKAFF